MSRIYGKCKPCRKKGSRALEGLEHIVKLQRQHTPSSKVRDVVERGVSVQEDAPLEDDVLSLELDNAFKVRADFVTSASLVGSHTLGQ